MLEPFSGRVYDPCCGSGGMFVQAERFVLNADDPLIADLGRDRAGALYYGVEDESLALTLALLMARESGLATTAPAFEGALAKIERVLPTATRARIQAVTQTVAFDGRDASGAPAGLAVMVLSSAIQSGRRVSMHYRSSRSEV